MHKAWKRLAAALLVLTLVLGLGPGAGAANSNKDLNSAIAVTSGATVEGRYEEDHVSLYYKLENVKAGQAVMIRYSSGIWVNGVWSISGGSASGVSHGDGGTCWYTTPMTADGDVVFCLAGPQGAFSFKATVYTPQASDLDLSAPLTFPLTLSPVYGTASGNAYGAVLRFDTSAPGMDICLSFDDLEGGYIDGLWLDGARLGRDNMSYYRVNSDYECCNIHLAEGGRHELRLGAFYAYADNGYALRTLNVTAELLAGDAYESNDAREQAKLLPIGTDAAFCIGGLGDEDWFSFDIAIPEGKSSAVYTLRLLDLNTDYSDNLSYTIYGPDGSEFASNSVNIQHNRILEFRQAGRYTILLYGRADEMYYETRMDRRTLLRIRLDEGGDDPYESNDSREAAAQIQPGQRIQHYLSDRSDCDWFYFISPQPDMTLKLSFDSDLYFSVQSGAGGFSTYNRTSSERSPYYAKLDAPGVYYIRLDVQGEADVQPTNRLRTMSIDLLPAEDDENNDYWKRATPIYENIRRRFDISAYGDVDWFRIDVPRDAAQLVFLESSGMYGDGYNYWSIYKEADFIQFGDHAEGYVTQSQWQQQDNDMTLVRTFALDGADRYYVRVGYDRGHDFNSNTLSNMYTNGRTTDQAICYFLIGDGSVANAFSLEPGEWSGTTYSVKVFRLGTLAEGDEIRASRRGGDTIELLAADGTVAASSDLAHAFFTVPADGDWYLRLSSEYMRTVQDGDDWDGDGVLDNIWNEHTEYVPKAAMLRYDVAKKTESGEREAAIEIEAPLNLVLTPGERYWLDLRLTPYDGWLGAAASGYRAAEEDMPEGELPIAVYDARTGYLTASATPDDGVLTVTLRGEDGMPEPVGIQVLVTENGYPQIQGWSEVMQVGMKTNLFVSGVSGSYTWSSTDERVLAVSQEGVLAAVGEGEARIRLIRGNTVLAETDVIYVFPPEEKPEVQSVVLDTYSLTLFLEEDPVSLTATVLPEDAAVGQDMVVAWTSSNPEAVTVDEAGLLTPVAPGLSIVTVEVSGEDWTRRASCIVTVHPKRVRVESIGFETEMLELPLGSTTALRVSFRPENATTRGLRWLSSDETTVSVIRTGLVTGLAVGEAVITATSTDGDCSAEIRILVTAAPHKGDINGDGYIDAADAMLALRWIVGLITLTEAQLAAGDVNGDGLVDAGDAVRILRYDAGLIDTVD